MANEILGISQDQAQVIGGAVLAGGAQLHLRAYTGLFRSVVDFLLAVFGGYAFAEDYQKFLWVGASPWVAGAIAGATWMIAFEGLVYAAGQAKMRFDLSWLGKKP